MTAQQKITASHKNVYVAICSAQLEFGAVTKGSVNPAFKSRYADLADVASVVIPTLAQHGVCVIQYLVGDDLNAMRTEFIHGESETKVSCDVPLIVDRQNMQGMKSATTYAKRIGLESLSGVAPEDDDGNDASKAPPPRREQQQKRPDPRQPDAEAIEAAADSLSNAHSLDALKAIWSDLPKAIQSVPKVITAKDTRKGELEAPEAPSGDDHQIDDEIPYQ